jgi:hypothetical protein
MCALASNMSLKMIDFPARRAGLNEQLIIAFHHAGISYAGFFTCRATFSPRGRTFGWLWKNGGQNSCFFFQKHYVGHAWRKRWRKVKSQPRRGGQCEMEPNDWLYSARRGATNGAENFCGLNFGACVRQSRGPARYAERSFADCRARGAEEDSMSRSGIPLQIPDSNKRCWFVASKVQIIMIQSRMPAVLAGNCRMITVFGMHIVEVITPSNIASSFRRRRRQSC